MRPYTAVIPPRINRLILRLAVRHGDDRDLEARGFDLTEARRWWERKQARRRRMARKQRRGWM